MCKPQKAVNLGDLYHPPTGDTAQRRIAIIGQRFKCVGFEPKRLLVAMLVPYVGWLVFAYEYHFIDGVNLAFHEAGHLFFSFLGQTLHVLGGTIGQLFFPAACCVHFIRRQQSVEAAVCCIWFAESLMYTARYLADAQALALPLVGGHIHDWNWLLSRAGLLGHCETIGTLLHVLASMIAIAALVWAAHRAFSRSERPGTGGWLTERETAA